MSSSAIDIRMKAQYEDRYRILLPRRSYTIVRVDGRAFHTWTRGMNRPYSTPLMEAMDYTALELCKGVQGARIGYVQSDEISLLLTDFEDIATQAWFDGNLQKICSISASIATAAFNDYWTQERREDANANRYPAHFDSRVFQIPDPVEVGNYFVARQKDAIRNSVAMLAQHYHSPKELHGVSCEHLHDMIHAKGDNWNDHPARFKQGAAIVEMPAPSYTRQTPVGEVVIPERLEWAVVDPPIFTRDRPWLDGRIPRHE